MEPTGRISKRSQARTLRLPYLGMLACTVRDFICNRFAARVAEDEKEPKQGIKSRFVRRFLHRREHTRWRKRRPTLDPASMNGLTLPEVHRGLDGDAVLLRRLVEELMPVVQSRAARALHRYRPRTRDVQQELSDLVQETFSSLFENDGYVLRRWDPERGLSLRNFVGLVSERTVGGILRSGKRTPWPDEPTDPVDLEHSDFGTSDPSPRIESRAQLETLLDRLQQVLSPRALELFQRLYVLQEDVRTVAERTGMTEQAVYAAKARLERTARKLAQEPLDSMEDA